MKIRISCASQASIKIDNKYLLCLNKSSLKRGEKVYTPFGGALEYYPEALDFLKNIEADFERKTPDLRFTTDISNLDLFEFWFNQKINRETSVDRELIEEMVHEEKIFDSLDKDDFKTQYTRTVKDVQEYNNIVNYRYFEVHDVKFKRDKIDVINDLLSKGTSNMILTTLQDIMQSRIQGIKIGGNAKSIL